jgi:hypothetical protein
MSEMQKTTRKYGSDYRFYDEVKAATVDKP